MRKLSLTKETLVQLSADELGDVVGGTMPTKFNCTESYQVCNPLSEEVCLEMYRPTYRCFPTMEGGC